MFEMSEEQFNECEQAEDLKHDDKLKELREEQKTCYKCGHFIPDKECKTCDNNSNWIKE